MNTTNKIVYIHRSTHAASDTVTSHSYSINISITIVQNMCVLSTFKTFSDFHLARSLCRFAALPRPCKPLVFFFFFILRFLCFVARSVLSCCRCSKANRWTIYAVHYDWSHSHSHWLLPWFSVLLVPIYEIGVVARARTHCFVLHLFWSLFNLCDFIYWLSHSRISKKYILDILWDEERKTMEGIKMRLNREAK